MKTMKTLIIGLIGLTSTSVFADVNVQQITWQGSSTDTQKSIAQKMYENLLQTQYGTNTPEIASLSGKQISCTVIHSMVPAGMPAASFYTCTTWVHLNDGSFSASLGD